MTGTDLRSCLAEIAADARPLDLYDRVVKRSRVLRRRRRAGTALAAAAAVLVVTGTAWQLLPVQGSGRGDGEGYALVGKVTDTALATGEAEDAYVSRLVAGQASVTAEIRADLTGGSDPPGYDPLVQERT